MVSKSILTNEQEQFLDILSNIGCMSEVQARHILRCYMGLRGNTVGSVLTSLSLRHLINKSLDGNFITPGGFAINEVVSRNMIECVAVMNSVYDQYIEEHDNDATDVRDNISFVFRPHSEFELSFISGGESYQLIHIPSDQLFRMTVVEKKMNDQKLALKQTASQMSVIPFTVFIFSAGVNEEAILSKIEDMGICIPHKLVFMKGRELEGNISFNVYGE